MASSRIARFIMEVAPPQYVTVMRHRTSKMLDTISEEDHREVSPNDHSSHSSASSPKRLSASASASSASPSSVSSTASTSACAAIATADTKYFLKEVHRSLSILNH